MPSDTSHLPTAGEIVLFDRSWYNRGGVEGCGVLFRGGARPSSGTHLDSNRCWIDDGIMLRKYWFSVSPDIQLERFRERANQAHKQWKLSPMDLASLDRWAEYSVAKDQMFEGHGHGRITLVRGGSTSSATLVWTASPTCSPRFHTRRSSQSASKSQTGSSQMSPVLRSNSGGRSRSTTHPCFEHRRVGGSGRT